MEDWLEIKLGTEVFRLREIGGELQVDGLDLEAEEAAALVSGQQPVWLVVLLVIRRLCHQHPLEELAAAVWKLNPRGERYQQEICSAVRLRELEGVSGDWIVAEDRRVWEWLSTHVLAPEVVEWVASHRSPRVRGWLLTNPNTSPEMLRRLVADPLAVAAASILRPPPM